MPCLCLGKNNSLLRKGTEQPRVPELCVLLLAVLVECRRQAGFIRETWKVLTLQVKVA